MPNGDNISQGRKTATSTLLLLLKGMTMGVGDSIPGVSGGTIAVITNIYEELILSLSKFDLRALRLFLAGHFKMFWLHVNGHFLFVLGLGILLGLLISANTVLFLIANYFEVLMAFFIGLVCASVWFLQTQVTWKNWKNCLAGLFGILLAVIVSMLPPQTATIDYLTIFFSGMVAICAMVLPGLSGAFILLILGVYEFILSALVGFQLDYILVFASGCAIGLLSFTHLLAWFLKRYHDLAYSGICGMLLGSITVLWPWQQPASTYVDNAGEVQTLSSANVFPLNYQDLTGNDPYLWLAIASLITGCVVVVVLHASFNSRPEHK